MKKRGLRDYPKVFLPKLWAWAILIALVVFDGLLDLIFAQGGGTQSGIWKPISNFLGVSNPLFLIPIVLVLFYLVIKGGTWLAEKVDKVPAKAEELILTTVVIGYGVFDLWLILVYFFDFRLFKNHYYLIPVLIIVGIAYEWWAENKIKKSFS